MKQEHSIVKILLAIWFLKSLVGFSSMMDAFIIFILVGLNIFLYFQDQILKSEKSTKQLQIDLEARISKLENQVSQLSLQNGFKR